MFSKWFYHFALAVIIASGVISALISASIFVFLIIALVMVGYSTVHTYLPALFIIGVIFAGTSYWLLQDTHRYRNKAA